MFCPRPSVDWAKFRLIAMTRMPLRIVLLIAASAEPATPPEGMKCTSTAAPGLMSPSTMLVGEPMSRLTACMPGFTSSGGNSFGS